MGPHGQILSVFQRIGAPCPFPQTPWGDFCVPRNISWPSSVSFTTCLCILSLNQPVPQASPWLCGDTGMTGLSLSCPNRGDHPDNGVYDSGQQDHMTGSQTWEGRGRQRAHCCPDPQDSHPTVSPSQTKDSSALLVLLISLIKWQLQLRT